MELYIHYNSDKYLSSQVIFEPFTTEHLTI